MFRFARLFLAFVIFTSFISKAFAESSALSGLGEPAAPESLANPGQLFPSDVSNKTAAPVIAPNPSGNPQGSIGSGGPASQPPIYLRPKIEQNIIDKPFTLKGAIQYAELNYPQILKGQSEMRAAKRNVTVQKLNEYLPDTLFQWQEIFASHNKLTQVFFGSPVFPAISGPSTNSTNMDPYFFSQGGFSIDWAPLDFGLHKARINLAKSMATEVNKQFASTQLDVEIACANAYLDSVIALEQVKAAEQNVRSFEEFYRVVHAQVESSLKPGADESLALAQLANARNQLIRAELARDLAFTTLANTMGLGGMRIDVDPAGISTYSEPANIQKSAPVFEQVPILQASHAALSAAVAQKKVLDKEYYPVLHFLGGFNMRGAGLSSVTAGQRTPASASGTMPTVPNYQVALIVNWNFLDIIRLHQEKKVQEERIYQQQQVYKLVLQTLRTQDLQSRDRVRAAIELAKNMPIQVRASQIALQQAEARYQTGLGSIAQVAQANETLAQSRVQDAVAKVGVWRALLFVASVHGDIKPLIEEADRVRRGI